MAEIGSNTAQVLAQYRRWKEDGEALRARAQALLVERFSTLIREAQELQHDLWEDFGQAVKFPANPKFVRKGKGRSSPRKSTPTPKSQVAKALSSPAPAIPANAPARRPEPPAASPVTARKAPTSAPLRAPSQTRTKSPSAEPVDSEKKRRQLRKLIEKTEAKLLHLRLLGDAAKIQNAEDRLYELNDDLRLLDEVV